MTTKVQKTQAGRKSRQSLFEIYLHGVVDLIKASWVLCLVFPVPFVVFYHVVTGERADSFSSYVTMCFDMFSLCLYLMGGSFIFAPLHIYLQRFRFYKVYRLHFILLLALVYLPVFGILSQVSWLPPENEWPPKY